jgi:tripartite-type tricarboxylate transporter receptor subunit TctC
MKSSVAVVVVSAAAFAACAHAAEKSSDAAASYPSRPVRVMIPQAPGGSNDIMARYVGGALSERLGRQFIIDNRPGGEGMIATETVARANPDGYTLLMASTAFTMNPAVIKKLPYDPIKDFDFVALFGRAPVVITVGPAVQQVGTLKDLIALGKAKPNFLTMASAGGFMHFASAMFRSHAGFKGEIALYKGGAPALIDVMSGNVQVAVATIPTASPALRSGKVRALAVGAAKRAPSLPDVPSTAEAGLPSFQCDIWWAWATTAGTPTAVINKLNREIAAVLQLPETAKRFAADSAEVEIRTPAELRKMIPADLAKWEKVAKDAGMPKQ